MLSLGNRIKYVLYNLYLVFPPCRTAMGNAKNIVNQNDNFWDKADPGIRRDYGEYFFSQTQVSIVLRHKTTFYWLFPMEKLARKNTTTAHLFIYFILFIIY